MSNTMRFMLVFIGIIVVWAIYGIATKKQPAKFYPPSYGTCSIKDGVSSCSVSKENLYKLPKGKPVLLLIRSDKLNDGKSMDIVFDNLKYRNSRKIRFIKLNWESDKAADFIGAYTLVAPPSSLFFDANGKYLKKISGKRKINDIQNILKSMNVKRIK